MTGAAYYSDPFTSVLRWLVLVVAVVLLLLLAVRWLGRRRRSEWVDSGWHPKDVGRGR